jgi:hypothetical protein
MYLKAGVQDASKTEDTKAGMSWDSEPQGALTSDCWFSTHLAHQRGIWDIDSDVSGCFRVGLTTSWTMLC